MRRVLVTGGAGFIGSHTVQALLSHGKAVTVLDDLSTGNEQNLSHLQGDLEFIKGSVCSENDLQRALANVSSVIHLAAVISVVHSVQDPVHCDEVNVHGTVKLLDMARRLGVRRLVLASSAAVYGEDPIQPKVETAPIQALSGYAASKACDEIYLKMFLHLYQLETVALRYFNVFGPRQSPNSQYAAVIPKFIDTMLRNNAPVIFGDGEQTRDFCFVENVVDANLRALQSPAAVGQSINIGTGKSTSLNQLVQMLNRILGSQFQPTYDAPVPGDIRHSLADITLARDALSYTPRVDVHQGLEQTIAYLRSTLKNAPP